MDENVGFSRCAQDNPSLTAATSCLDRRANILGERGNEPADMTASMCIYYTLKAVSWAQFNSKTGKKRLKDCLYVCIHFILPCH